MIVAPLSRYAFRACLAAAGLVAPALFAGGANAHPHVWVTVHTEILVSGSGEITGFRHRWAFDEFYTSFAIQGLDKDGDGNYSAEELKPLADVNIQSLKEFGFFTYPKLGENELPRKEPEDYRLEYTDGILTLHFTLQLEKPLPISQASTFSFSVYDPAFYVAFSFAEENPVTLAAGAPSSCRPKLGETSGNRSEITLGQSLGEAFDPSADIGSQFARTVTLDCTSS